MLMVVVAVVGVISLTSLALAQVAATRLDQARNEAIADFVALAAVQNQLDAGPVADANGGQLLRLDLSSSGAVVLVGFHGQTAMSSAHIERVATRG